uniref:Uncharacterized protein n=1 Tax=Cannabis sativa TaxID=3483 RepID=A0A803QRT2_CANSA
MFIITVGEVCKAVIRLDLEVTRLGVLFDRQCNKAGVECRKGLHQTYNSAPERSWESSTSACLLFSYKDREFLLHVSHSKRGLFTHSVFLTPLCSLLLCAKLASQGFCFNDRFVLLDVLGISKEKKYPRM